MKHIALRALIGLGIGLTFALLQFMLFSAAESVFHDHTVQPMRSLELAFRTLNAPAEWLAHVWTNVLRLPPRGEVAWLLVPIVTVSLQWGFIGVLGGICCGHKLR